MEHKWMKHTDTHSLSLEWPIQPEDEPDGQSQAKPSSEGLVQVQSIIRMRWNDLSSRWEDQQGQGFRIVALCSPPLSDSDSYARSAVCKQSPQALCWHKVDEGEESSSLVMPAMWHNAIFCCFKAALLHSPTLFSSIGACRFANSSALSTMGRGECVISLPCPVAAAISHIAYAAPLTV